MLILKELSLKNFLSHENTTIKFKPNQKLLIDGVSGAGKSSIVESLIWGLYGRGRSDNRSLIKRGKKSTHVSIILEDVDTKDFFGYKIERSITKTGIHNISVLKIKNDNSSVLIKVNGLKKIQEYLEKNILHSSYLLFVNSIVHPQNNIESFVKQTAPKRKDIILEIVNASDYDEYYDKIKKKINELSEEKLIKNKVEIKNLEENIKKNKEKSKQLNNLKKEREKINKEKSVLKKEFEKIEKKLKEINTIVIKYNEKDNQKVNIEIKINKLEKKIKDELNELYKYSTQNIKTLEKKLKNFEENKKKLKELQDLEEKSSIWHKKTYELIQNKPIDLDYDKSLNELNLQLINIMTEDIEICPVIHKKCPLALKKRQKSIKYFEDQIKNKNKEKKEFLKKQQIYLEEVEKLGKCPVVDKEKMKILKEKIDEQEHIKIKLEKSDIIRNNIDNNINNLKEELISAKNEYKKLVLELKELKKNSVNQEKIKKEKYELNHKINELQFAYEENLHKLTLAEDAKKSIDNSIKRINKIKKEQKQTIEKIESLELLKKAFGPNGIKSIVIDYVIPMLEEKINNTLSQLSDFRIRLDTQKVGINKDKMIEGLFINIFNELGEEFNFDNYSGGERLKIIVAMSEALSEIQNIGFRILDELFIGLDEESAEKFIKVINSLQKKFNQLVCISHLRGIKDIFNEKITVKKVNGTSLIEK